MDYEGWTAADFNGHLDDIVESVQDSIGNADDDNLWEKYREVNDLYHTVKDVGIQKEQLYERIIQLQCDILDYLAED